MAEKRGVFNFLFATDLVAAAIALYFFNVGLVDGSVSSANLGLWLALLAGIAGVLVGSLWLRKRGVRVLPVLLLLVVAIPTLTYAAFLLLVLVTQPRWN